MKQIRRLLGHIVSSFILNKRISRNTKHLIEYGVMRKMKEKRDFRKKVVTPKKFKHNIAVVAIMKNEGPYLQEWIEYHKLVGVEKFYLYDNESSDDTKEILKPYIKSGLVDYTFWPGQKMQLPAYNDFIKKHKNDTKWLAIIDLDEYLVPTKKDNILDVLNEYSESVAQFIVSWVVFGSNGHQTKPDGLVLENYTKRARHNWLYKSIINPRMAINMGCHEHEVAGKTVSIPTSKLRAHHYHCKSWQEYQTKAMRGDAWDGADAGMKKYQMECFKRHDLNDVADTTVLRFVPQLHKIIK